MKMRLTRIIPCGLLLALLIPGVVGCRAPGRVPKLTGRETFEVEMIVETDPPGAVLLADDLRETRKDLAIRIWRFEKLTWSDGRIDLRLLPEGTPVAIGEEMSAIFTARAKDFKEKTVDLSFSFSGKPETVKRKIVLEKLRRKK